MIDVDHNDDHPVQNDDQSLSIADAAKHLDLSPATIRRRIKDRKLAAFQRPTERGFEWRILPDQSVENLDHIVDQPVHIVAQAVSIDMQNDEQPLENDDHNDDQAVLKALEMLDEERRKVDDLQEQLREASTAAAHWQARAVTAEQTVQRLLPAPKDEPAPEPPAEPERPWWKRLFS
jgi:DNA repair exonuclease SbcCD ATPase subunit